MKPLVNTKLADAIAKAEAQGHRLVCDAPGYRRYTCQKRGCGRALLMPEGVVYGSAITEPCTGEEDHD